MLLFHRDPLTVNDLSLGGTNTSCLGDFGGPVMPWVALGGYTGLYHNLLICSPVACDSLLQPSRGAEYCDQSVCVSVHERISGTAGPIFIKLFVHIHCRRG